MDLAHPARSVHGRPGAAAQAFRGGGSAVAARRRWCQGWSGSQSRPYSQRTTRRRNSGRPASGSRITRTPMISFPALARTAMVSSTWLAKDSTVS
ncbi:hypothetical protein ACN24K_14230 [Streptomyces microflavus]